MMAKKIVTRKIDIGGGSVVFRAYEIGQSRVVYCVWKSSFWTIFNLEDLCDISREFEEFLLFVENLYRGTKYIVISSNNYEKKIKTVT